MQQETKVYTQEAIDAAFKKKTPKPVEPITEISVINEDSLVMAHIR